MRILLQNILLIALLLAPIASVAEPSSGGAYFPVKNPSQYPAGQNDPEVPAECLPDYVLPTYNQAPCTHILEEIITPTDSSGSSGDVGNSSSSSSGDIENTSGGDGDNNNQFLRNNEIKLFGATIDGGGNDGNNGTNDPNTNTSEPPSEPSTNPSTDPSTEPSTSGGETPTGSSGGSVAGEECDAGAAGTVGTAEEVECSVYEQCTDNCVEETICKKYAKDAGGNCICVHSIKIQKCQCAPKCTITDPVNYPACCSVEPKPKENGVEYPCIKVCLLPNGDKVDVPENEPRCKNFKGCCYGQKNNGEKFTDPVETEPGDPKDQCRLKCNDICNDKLFVPRGKDISDVFPQCCTPPIPLHVACYCCRDNTTKNSPQCEYFRRMFSCNDARLDCTQEDASKALICTDPQSVQVDPSAFDDNYDPYLEHDPRFEYCSSPTSNLACQYICRGRGVTKPEDAPTQGMWAPDPSNANAEVYESNSVLHVHGNCDVGEVEKKNVPWPPQILQQQETCSGQ